MFSTMPSTGTFIISAMRTAFSTIMPTSSGGLVTRMMPFTGSISEGIVLGLLSYVFMKVCTGRREELSVVMYVLAAFFVLKYIVN